MPHPSDQSEPQRPAPIEPLNRPQDRGIYLEVGAIALILIGTSLGAVFGWLELLAKAHP